MASMPALLEKKNKLMTKISSPDGLKQLAAALPKHIDAQRFARLTLSAMNRNPALIECRPESFLFAMMRCAEFGLLPDGRQGALVPFKGEVTFIPMYQGLIDCACRSGKVQAITPQTLYENDKFTYREGLNPTLEHTPTFDSPGKMLAVYAVAHLTNGSTVSRLMPMWRVEEHKARSPSVKAKRSSPWDTDYEAMAWKTVIRELCKFLPQSAELAEMLEADNEAYTSEKAIEGKTDIEGEFIDLSRATQPEAGMTMEEPPPPTDKESLTVELPPADELPPLDAYEAPATKAPPVEHGFVVCPGPRKPGKKVPLAACAEVCPNYVGCEAVRK